MNTGTKSYNVDENIETKGEFTYSSFEKSEGEGINWHLVQLSNNSR